MGAVPAAMLIVGPKAARSPALGDTLFPAASLADGLAQTFAPGASLFVRLRVLHPLLAATTGAAVVLACGLVRALRPSAAVRALSLAATAIVALQLAAGILNHVLHAPVPLQLVHLELADSLWIALVLTAAAALSVAPQPARLYPSAAPAQP